MVPPAAPLEHPSAVPILMYTPLGQVSVPVSSASRSRYGVSGPTGVTGVDQTGGLKRWKLIKVEEEVKERLRKIQSDSFGHTHSPPPTFHVLPYG